MCSLLKNSLHTSAYKHPHCRGPDLRILVTNDDGINSPGLWSVADALKPLGEVIVVAPDRDLSGVSAAMTLMAVLRAQEVAAPIEGVKAYSVQGTPGDCVILATEALVKAPFDLVVSGINQGANFGMDVINSGTVGGAFHGYFRNIPSIAVSVASLTSVRYDAAARVTSALAKAIFDNPMPSPLLLNVNLPNIGLDEIEEVQLTRLGPKAFLENVERGSDGRKEHFWIKHNRSINTQPEEGTDRWAVRNKRVSITPIDVVFTNGPPHGVFESIAKGLTEELTTRVQSQ